MDKNYKKWAPFILRLTIGFGFAAHGWVKLNRGPAGFEKLLNWAGVPMAHIIAWLVPHVELLGGLAIMAGAFTAIVVIPLICTMVVAIITVQFKFGYSSVNTIGLTPSGPKFGPPGYEINLLYIAGLIVLILSGPGALSIDGWLAGRQNKVD